MNDRSLWARGCAVMALLALFLADHAAAHEPYTGLKHPATGLLCCNGHDCTPIAAERVEQVPGADVIPSWDGEPHACFWPSPDTLRCLVVPLAM